MAEFCFKCSKKLGLHFDGFYEGEICENCGVVKTKKLNIFTRFFNFIYYRVFKR